MTITKRIVIIESPYAGDVETNVAYARACMRDSLLRGEAPYASHLLYTQDGVLNDLVPAQRKHGIEAGFVFKHIPGAVTVFYTDLGFSSGMAQAELYCKEHGLPIDKRRLDRRALEAIGL